MSSDNITAIQSYSIRYTAGEAGGCQCECAVTLAEIVL